MEATPNQRRVLLAYGINPAGMTKAKAAFVLTDLQNNGWLMGPQLSLSLLSSIGRGRNVSPSFAIGGRLVRPVGERY